VSKPMRFACTVALALALACAPHSAAFAASESGWWVVLASIATPDNNFTPQVEAEVKRVDAAAKRCGIKAFWDFSSKFRGFARDYTVVVTGPYAAKSAAEAALTKAKPCAAGAYIKQGTYAGE